MATARKASRRTLIYLLRLAGSSSKGLPRKQIIKNNLLAKELNHVQTSHWEDKGLFGLLHEETLPTKGRSAKVFFITSVGRDFLRRINVNHRDIPSQMSARSITNGTPLIWLEQPVFTLKEGEDILARHKANKLNLATDVDFAWPQRWNEKTLQRAYTLANFAENYLLEVFEAEPEPEIQPITPEILQSCLTKSVNWLDEVPVINADLSSISPRGTDCCGIIGGLWSPMTKVLTVTRILHQKFTEPSDFLRQIRTFYGDYCTSLNRIRFRVENNRDEEQLFESNFEKQGTVAEFLPSTGHKYERVSTLWDAIRSGKVKFADDLKSRKEWQILVSQVCNFSGVESGKDDAVDSLAQLWLFVQTITAAEPSLNVPDFGDDIFSNGTRIDLPQHTPPISDEEYADVDFLSRFTVR